MKSGDVFKKSRSNIVLLCVGIVIACLIIFAGITQLFYQSRLMQNVDQQLLTHKNMIIKNPRLIDTRDGKEQVNMSPPMTPNLISFVWKDDRLLDEGPHAYLGEEAYPVFPTTYQGGVINLSSAGYTYRGVSFEKEGLRIELLMNIDSELRSVKQLQSALIVAFLILILVALVLAPYLAAFTLKAIRQAYDKQSFFVQDASHEMRTPLAIIKGQIELLACHTKDTIEEHAQELSHIIKEIRGLEKLNSNLLILSKENIKQNLEYTTFSLNSFIKELQEFYLDLAQMQEKNLEIQAPPEDVQVNWDKANVKRCVIILLENAFNYTQAGDEIKWIVKKKGKMIEMQIIDTGMGIKEEDHARIFDRFFRSGEVRAKGIEGSGIGLSLLKSIANHIGIKIQFQSEYKKGTEFTLTIPINR